MCVKLLFVKRILVALLLLLAVVPSYASHFAGGQIWYEYNGTNYTVHLQLIMACEGGAVAPDTVELLFKSVSKGVEEKRIFTGPVKDTLGYDCNKNSSCYVPANTNYPGHVVYNFTDTVSLSRAKDWEFYYTECCVNNSVLNGMGNGTMAVYTTMDNSGTEPLKSSLHVPALDQYYIRVNDTFSIPFQYVAGEIYDSTVLRVVDPSNGIGTTAPYRPYPYVLAQPLGFNSLLKYDELTRRLDISCTTQGKFYLAFEVAGYNNGQLVNKVHIQTELIVLPNIQGSKRNITLRQNSYPEVVACEGQSGVRKIFLEDFLTNDSIYVQVDYPQTPGAYNISHTVLSDKGKAEVALNWSVGTPTFTPQPAYCVRLRYGTKKSGCTIPEGTYSIVFRITDSCAIDSVWPGDADDDGVVTLKDVLAIGMNYKNSSWQRHSVSNSWLPYYCFDWERVWSSKNINGKHADCNGDGIVDTADLHAITDNFSKTHPRPGAAKPTAGPVIYYDTTGIVFAPGATVSVPIKIGSATDKLPESLYGWAADLSIGNINLSAPLAVNGGNSWLSSGNYNVFHRQVYAGNNNIGWAHARTNGNGISNGHGLLGMATFTIPITTTTGTIINLNIANAVLIDDNGDEITNFSTRDTTAVVGWPVSVGTAETHKLSAVVAPNPAEGRAYLHLQSQGATSVHVIIAAIDGRVIYDKMLAVKNKQVVSLPISTWASGVYTVSIISADGLAQHLKMVKQ